MLRVFGVMGKDQVLVAAKAVVVARRQVPSLVGPAVEVRQLGSQDCSLDLVQAAVGAEEIVLVSTPLAAVAQGARLIEISPLREARLPTPDPELVDIKGRRYYRVRVGPVVERAEAEGMLDKVSEIAGTKAQVRQYP